MLCFDCFYFEDKNVLLKNCIFLKGNLKNCIKDLNNRKI